MAYDPSDPPLVIRMQIFGQDNYDRMAAELLTRLAPMLQVLSEDFDIPVFQETILIHNQTILARTYGIDSEG